ncbi:MAG: hypothetical protein AAB553_01815 [Patescibacteria group bacterium]
MNTDSLPQVATQQIQSSQSQSSGILQQTLGELLKNNTHAQGMVMQAMRITPAQLQQMLSATSNNQLMQMPIGDLFKNGMVQQVVSQQSGNNGQVVQLSPEQAQQILAALPAPQQEETLWQKIRKSMGL